jgi:hypothetical protein
MERLLNVATPATAAVVAVPESVPTPGFVPIATVTEAVLDVTVFPFASWIFTVTAGEIDAPAATLDGCVPKATFEAAPGVTLNAVDVAPVSPVLDAVSVYPLPVLLIERLLKVATPLTALTVAVPESVPTPGFVPIAIVTAAVLPLTTAPVASWICTVTAGVIDAPATVFVGWVAIATFVAEPLVRVSCAVFWTPA